MSRQHQYGRLPAERQGEVSYETTVEHPALVRIDHVSHTINIHLPDPQVALRNPVQGHEQGGGGFYGLRIR